MARTAAEQANLDKVLTTYREVLVAMNPDKADEYLPPSTSSAARMARSSSIGT